MSIVQSECAVAADGFLSGRHLPAHNYTMALYRSDASLGSQTTRYLTASETSGSGYTAGGQVLASYARARSGSTSFLDWTDSQWPKSTFSTGGCVIYNASLASKEAIGVFNFGSVEVSNGTFTAILPPASAVSAVVRIGAGF